VGRTWRLNAHKSARPLLQSRYPWLQSPNVGERDLCSHPDAECIGDCITLADIGRAGWGWRHAVAVACEKSSTGAHRCCGPSSAGAKLHVLLSPASVSIPARVADLDFVSWRESETTAPTRELVDACSSLSRRSRAERFSANFRDRLATVRVRFRGPLGALGFPLCAAIGTALST